ncbi:MAG: PAS domain-containing sensor histidine kinase [Flavobacteriales bacterium]|nr:PAS domain-containing sensor histidine kinase [Flavobacteriales bacterium]
MEQKITNSKGLRHILNLVLEHVNQYQDSDIISSQEKSEIEDISEIIRQLDGELELRDEAIRNAEKDVLTFQSKFLSLYENAPDMLVSIIPETAEIKECNQTLCRITGYNKEELIGEQIFKLYAPESMKQGIDAIKALSKNMRVENDETVLLKKDGSKIETSFKEIRVFDQNGDVIENRLSFRDITEKKSIERKLKRQADELQRINNELKEFTYIASHDLKVPIANMEQLVKILREEDLEAAEKTDFLDRLGKMVSRSKSTIQDLVDVTRIRENSELTKEQINLEEIYSEVMMNFRETVEIENIKMNTNFSSAPSLLFARQNLNSVFQNLISNAIKYQRDDIQTEISIRSNAIGPYVELHFEDNGIGIDLKKHKNKLFGMFNRFNSAKEGTGLGLYIVKQIIDKSGGSIEVESSLGQGTSFTILLPLES